MGTMLVASSFLVREAGMVLGESLVLNLGKHPEHFLPCFEKQPGARLAYLQASPREAAVRCRVESLSLFLSMLKDLRKGETIALHSGLEVEHGVFRARVVSRLETRAKEPAHEASYRVITNPKSTVKAEHGMHRPSKPVLHHGPALVSTQWTG